MRGHKLLILGVALLVVSGAGALPLVTSSSFSDQTVNNGSLISAVPDWVAPTVPAAAIGKTAGGTTGFIRANGTYYIYANATDTGAPASGIATVRANVNNVTTGQTAVTLVAGTYTAGGVSYQYRSPQLTARAGLPTGALAFSITATDNAAGATTTGFSVTGDNTAPSASAVQAANVGGGTLGRLGLGDTLTLTYSEVMDSDSILAGWNGSQTNVILVLVNGGTASDYIQVYSPAQVVMPLGTVTLNRTDFIAGATGNYVTFGLTGTPSAMTASGAAISFVLGTASGAVTTAAGTGTMSWTPSATATDRAGNPSTTTVRTESGTSDRDF